MLEETALRIAAGDMSIGDAVEAGTMRDGVPRPVGIGVDAEGRAAAVLFLIDSRKDATRAECVIMERDGMWEAIAQSGVSWQSTGRRISAEGSRTEILLETRTPFQEDGSEIAAILGRAARGRVRASWPHGHGAEANVGESGYFVVCAVVPEGTEISIA